MSLAGARLGIMTADDFKNRTKATKAVCGFSSRFKSRGSAMARIDNALENWDAKCNSNIDTAKKLALVIGIAFECQQWIKKKGDKGSRLSSHRKQVIEQLYKSLQAPIQFLRNKVRNEAGTNINPTKKLAGNFAFERQDYLARGKTENPYAASVVAEQPDFDTMSYDRFVQVGGEENYRVTYMNRSERMEHMLTLENGLVYRQGEPYDCTLDERQNSKMQGGFDRRIIAETYACDKYGNLFSKPIKGFNGTYFNHSSYCAGKEIICAGTLATKDGKLLYISNLSGHYKPSPAALGWLLVMLAEEDIDLTDVCVTAADANGMRQCKATSIIRSARAASDWPDMNGELPQVIVNGQLHSVMNPK